MQKIRAATAGDAATLLELIGGLADYEHLRDELRATPELLAEHLFGAAPAAEAVLAERDGTAVGFALFFPTFSTFLAKPGLWLEDLFVLPEHRRGGVGRALFVHVAQVAVARDCGRLEWSALDWNEPALAFYRGLGARRMRAWRTHRIDGAALRALGTPGR